MKVIIDGAVEFMTRAGEPVDTSQLDMRARADVLWIKSDPLSYYLDARLADIGVVEGRIAIKSRPQAFRILGVYRSPRRLTDEEVVLLRDETVGQWQDGVGEGGFDVSELSDGCIAYFKEDESLVVTQEDDGVVVPGPAFAAIAARDGNYAALADALEGGADTEHMLQGYSPLHLSILYGHSNEAHLLLEYGANPNRLSKDFDSPIAMAVLSNAMDDSSSAAVIDVLMRYGAVLTHEDASALIMIARDRGKMSVSLRF